MNGYATLNVELPTPAMEWLTTLHQVSGRSIEQILVMVLSDTSPKRVTDLANNNH